MNLMFWKKKTPDDTEEGEADDDRTAAIPRDAETTEEHEEDAVRPGLLARLRNALSALRKPRNSSAEVDATEAEAPGEDKPAATDRQDDEEPVVPLRNLKKQLIIGGAIGLLVVLLAGTGFAITKIFLPHPEQKKATAETSHTSTPQTEIDALKKKNADLQAQIEAIKKGQPPASPNMEAGENAASSSSASSGEMTISNKDPKAAAQALRAAIEEMNASSVGAKPHKPAP